MRVCPTCNESEPNVVFIFRRKPCKQCLQDVASEKAKAKRAVRRAASGPKKNAKRREYDEQGNLISRECGTCKKMLPTNAFNSNPSHKDGLNNVCRECTKIRWNETANDKRVAYLVHRLKSKAKSLSVPFNLSPEDISIPDTCPVLGIPLVFGKSSNEDGWRDNSPSIDRIVPHLGYTKHNVIVVSYRANRIKNDATVDELQKVASFYRQLTSGSRDGWTTTR